MAVVEALYQGQASALSIKVICYSLAVLSKTVFKMNQWPFPPLELPFLRYHFQHKITKMLSNENQ